MYKFCIIQKKIYDNDKFKINLLYFNINICIYYTFLHTETLKTTISATDKFHILF